VTRLIVGVIICCGLGMFVKGTSHPDSRFDFHEKPSNKEPLLRDEANQSVSNSIVGCMAASCHANADPKAEVSRRAARIWLDTDFHARAYTALLTNDSLEMINRLVRKNFASTSEKEYRELLEQKCVSCHASSHAPIEQRMLGIDCQACHGPASAWDEKHYSKEWLESGSQRFKNSKMRDTESLSSRATICVSCHIGDLKHEPTSREVDHDLMAAGHPPMHFDFSVYFDKYPAHWNTIRDRIRYGEFVDFLKWRVGKLAAARQRVTLLYDRAIAATEKRHIWPELAEQSCYRCHHALQPLKDRSIRVVQSKCDWDAWTIAELDLAFRPTHEVEWNDRLTTLLKSLESVDPDPTSVAMCANSLLELLDVEIKETGDDFSTDIASLQTSLETLANRDVISMSWEEAVPWVIATRAYRKSLGYGQSQFPEFIFQSVLGFYWEPRNPNQSGRMMNRRRDFGPKFLDSYRRSLIDRLREHKQ